MELIIKIPDEVYKTVLDGSYCGSLYEELLAAIPYNLSGDLISREALRKEVTEKVNFTTVDGHIAYDKMLKLIDNAPTVEARPQGEWYEYISKGLLKARHGDYVIYKVDFLLDNLAREVNIMESARRMKGGAE